MTQRFAISAFFAVLLVHFWGPAVSNAGTIQGILDGGGSLTSGKVTFTFTNTSASGTGQNGASRLRISTPRQRGQASRRPSHSST